MQKYVLCLVGFLFMAAASAGGGFSKPAFGAEPKSTGPASGKAGQQMTLKDAQNQAAARRKSKGQMRSTTNDDRWAAAKRSADRRAKFDARKVQGRSK